MNKPTRRLAYSYVRMSTEKQIKGDSLRRQLEWSEGFALRHDLDLQDTTAFADIGVSAWKGLNRSKGRLGAFIDLVRDRNIPSSSYLLIENLDRLSRTTPLEALDLFKEILKLGITVVARGEWGDEETYTWQSLNSNSNQLISTLSTMLRANRESERKSQTIREAFENKRALSRQGIKTNQTPPRWITATKVDRGRFEYSLNSRAPLVQWIFKRSADGVGLDRIARELNERSEPTLKPSKRGWFYTSIAGIINSRSAIGEYQPYEEVNGTRVASGDPIADYYPAVVTTDLWLRAQKTPHRNRRGGRAGTAFSNLLGDLANCQHCNSRMFMLNNSRSEKQWQYLVCSSAHRRIQQDVQIDGETRREPVCTQGKLRFRYDLVERFILDHVTEFGDSDEIRLANASAELQASNEAIADETLKLDSLRAREQRLQAVVETEDASDIPGLVQTLKTRTKERIQAEARLQELTQNRAIEMAKEASLDPVSAIKAMREEWEKNEGISSRYALRVRTSAAIKSVVQQVNFDSENGLFDVILTGNRRVYRFPNVKHAKGKSLQELQIKPIIVDVSRFLQEVPLGRYVDTIGPNATPEMEATFAADARIGAIPLPAGAKPVNDLLQTRRKTGPKH